MAIGGGYAFVARHHWLEWISVVAYLLVGVAALGVAFSRDGAKVRAFLAENPRLRWGVGLAVPALLVLLGSRPFHYQLHDVVFWPLAIVGAVGMFVLFHDLG